MIEIKREDIANRLQADNPWWEAAPDPNKPPMSWPRRAYYVALKAMILQPVQRAVILMGARRVGKTTLLYQLIGDSTNSEEFEQILFASVDAPTFSGLRLEQILELLLRSDLMIRLFLGWWYLMKSSICLTGNVISKIW